MLGAIIGDIVGSRFEFNNTNDFNFTLFTNECSFTDDTICTVAVADALLKGKSYRDSILEWCKRYPHPMGGYGASFARWVASDNPQPYNSFGNGAAMRVAPVAWYYDDLEDVKKQAELTASISHNHPEGIKGAIATAMAINLARNYDKSVMLGEMSQYYTTWVEPLLGQNKFDETCQGTMPVVFGIINRADSFEEAIRYAVAVGGDSDTIGAIVGSIAEAIWEIPKEISDKAFDFLPTDMLNVIGDFFHELNQRRYDKRRTD